ncbi:uncharacterized protein LOC144660534 isoform X1 [Oculina patagonica]
MYFHRYLSSNAITFLPDRVFANLKNLWTLYLSSNAITFLPDRVFANLTKLNSLDLSYNKMEYLSNDVLLRNLGFLNLQNNMITFISNETFAETTHLQYLFLGANQLQNIPYRAFANVAPRLLGRHEEHILIFSDNPIKTIEPEVFRWDNFHNKGMHM